MRRRRGFRQMVWLVAVALLAQTWLAPFAATMAAEKTDGMVICTGVGFKVIPFPSDGEPVPPPSDDGAEDEPHTLDCAACLLQAIAKDQPARSPSIMAWPTPVTLATAAGDIWPGGEGRDNPSRPRGPPAA